MSLYNHGVSSVWWQDVVRERKKRGKYKESDGLVNREVIFKTNQEGGKIMSKQVLSIEQMNHLQKLGIDTSNASFVKIEYDEHDGENRHLISILVEENHYLNDDSIKESVNVYTLQDILEKLPPIIDEVYWLTLEVMDRRKNEWKIKYARINAEYECASFSSESLIDAAYDMLCWLYENDYLPFKN